MAYTPDSQQLAEQAQEALEQASKIKSTGKGTVFMPNAIGVKAKPFIEARARLHKQQNDVFQNPEKLLKSPKGGAHYLWARLNQPTTVMRAGSGQYRYVKPEELKSELRDMFVTHTGVSKDRVCHGSLVLCECSQQAWVELFVEPEIESVARLASQEEYFQAQIEQESQGTAQGTVERVREDETLVPGE